MFIRYYLELAVPSEDVERALLDEPATWVPGIALDAEAGGQRLLAEVGFDVDATRRVDKEVEIEIGEPYVLPSKTMLPIAWKATTAGRIFPQLEADIEIAALGSHRSQLSISARYRPPLGPVGRVLDKALLHRVAEATVKDFLDRVGDRITARVSQGVDG
jgi:hypothetical protein